MSDDELLYIPGRWKYPDGSIGFRVTRIYVSSKASTENGKNNVFSPQPFRLIICNDRSPKLEHSKSVSCRFMSGHSLLTRVHLSSEQVADFDIDTSNGSTRINVTHPGASSPFFKAEIKPMFLLSSVSVPFSSRVLGKYCTLIQPPLPAGERPEEVATNEWASVMMGLKGKAGLAVIRSVYGDGVGVPAITPWGVGFHVENFVSKFGVAATNNPLIRAAPEA
jgi:hypothetical protein